MPNLFQDNTKAIPMKPDGNIVRVDMVEQQIGGRLVNLPKDGKSPFMGIRSIGNRDTK